jgi:hypothetical protein
VPHQHILLHLEAPVIYALQRHQVVSGPILSPYLKCAVSSSTCDGDVKGAELAEEEEQRRTKDTKLGAYISPILGWRKAQVERGPARSWREGGTPGWRDHPQLRCAIEMEGIPARGDVDLVGNSEDGLETYALLTCRFISLVKRGKGRVEAGAPMKPRVEFLTVLVLPPISHIALTLSAEKPSSLHSNTTRPSSIWRFSEGMTSSAYVLSSAFCINSSKKWVFLLYRSLESLYGGVGKTGGEGRGAEWERLTAQERAQVCHVAHGRLGKELSGRHRSHVVHECCV